MVRWTVLAQAFIACKVRRHCTICMRCVPIIRGNLVRRDIHLGWFPFSGWRERLGAEEFERWTKILFIGLPGPCLLRNRECVIFFDHLINLVWLLLHWRYFILHILQSFKNDFPLKCHRHCFDLWSWDNTFQQPVTPVEPATIQPIRRQPHTGQLQVGMTSSDYTHSARNSWRLESFVGWISEDTCHLWGTCL